MGNKDSRAILIVGAESVGKTTLFNKFINNYDEAPSKTKKWASHEITRNYLGKDYALTLYDMPGDPALRSIWKFVYSQTLIKTCLFVVDGENNNSIAEAKKHLEILRWEPHLLHARFIVVVNHKLVDKTAIKLSYAKVRKRLEDLKNRVQFANVSAKSGPGCQELLDILCQTEK